MTTSIKYSVNQCCDIKEYLGVNGLRLLGQKYYSKLEQV